MDADSTLSRGDLVDRYEIRELIGEGGMGAIYRAIDTRLGRSVALKIVRRDLAAEMGEPARKRFLREALAMSKVEHRNVVRVIDFGFWRETPYLAMELLRGQDLGKLVDATVGFLPVGEVVDVMLGICAAIRACHDAGVIHRDLKPSNIFLCEGDGGREVRILDFGISKLTTSTSTTTLTKDGEIVGTPQFLAPEQLAGKALPQTDQYAIGVVLYQCLTKSLPHQRHANVMSVLRAIDIGDVTPPRALRGDIPEKLERVILRAMQPAPANRFESVHALGRALWEFASPLERDRWRAYYFDERASAPKASTHAMPLIEALARGLAQPGQSGDPVGLAPRAAGPSGAEPVRAAPPSPSGAEPVRPAPPSPRAAEPIRVAPPAPAASQAPADPSEPSTNLKTRPPARARWLLAAALLAAGALALAGGRWWSANRPAPEAPPQAVQPIAPPPAAPVPATPPPPAAPVLAAPDSPPSAPPAPPPPPATGPTKTGGQKHHRRNVGERTADHASDGVPILP